MADYERDANLLANLEKAKSKLHTFYHDDHYSGFTLSTDTCDPLATSPVVQNMSLQKVDFTARYKQTNHRVTNKLEDYFKLGQEDFDTC